MNENSIVLYPSNWLYNAGVVGFLRVLNEVALPVDFSEDGGVSLRINNNDQDLIFGKWKEMSAENRIYGAKDAYYANQTESCIRKRLARFFVANASKAKKKSDFVCCFCTSKVQTTKSKAARLNQAFSNVLLGSEKSFSNTYWSNSASDFVCPRCEFVLMCHHLGLTKLSDGSEAFINAPSFKVMWCLNKLMREAFGSSSWEEGRRKRDVLAISLIEYALKVETTLGVWVEMNVEMVNKISYYDPEKKKTVTRIDFFTLPHEVVRLLRDRRVASLLSRIGEYSILNMFLDQDFSRLMETGYRLLRVALTPKNESKEVDKFIKRVLHLAKNRENPARTAQYIFKLCALVEEQRKRRDEYEWRDTGRI